MADETAAEIPCWIFGQLKWVSGINRNTTAEEVRVFFKLQRSYQLSYKIWQSVSLYACFFLWILLFLPSSGVKDRYREINRMKKRKEERKREKKEKKRNKEREKEREK